MEQPSDTPLRAPTPPSQPRWKSPGRPGSGHEAEFLKMGQGAGSKGQTIASKSVKPKPSNEQFQRHIHQDTSARSPRGPSRMALMQSEPPTEHDWRIEVETVSSSEYWPLHATSLAEGLAVIRVALYYWPILSRAISNPRLVIATSHPLELVAEPLEPTQRIGPEPAFGPLHLRKRLARA